MPKSTETERALDLCRELLVTVAIMKTQAQYTICSCMPTNMKAACLWQNFKIHCV